MSNSSNMLKFVDEESFLTESEVREIIRRRIIVREAIQNPIYQLILEQQGTGTEDIAAALDRDWETFFINKL